MYINDGSVELAEWIIDDHFPVYFLFWVRPLFCALDRSIIRTMWEIRNWYFYHTEGWC